MEMRDMSKLVDMTGQRFGRLVVVRRAGRINSQTHWLCRCDCGGDVVASRSHLRLGHTVACGCRQREMRAALHERSRTHGESFGTREFICWKSMIQRCHDESSKSYRRWGALGIRVCDEWRGPGGYERFLAHVGRKPTALHTIDRIDNTRGYEPGNVRWATLLEQANNKRNSRMVTVLGRTMTVAELARERGIKMRTLWSRLKRGWTVERAAGYLLDDGGE